MYWDFMFFSAYDLENLLKNDGNKLSVTLTAFIINMTTFYSAYSKALSTLQMSTEFYLYSPQQRLTYICESLPSSMAS